MAKRQEIFLFLASFGKKKEFLKNYLEKNPAKLMNVSSSNEPDFRIFSREAANARTLDDLKENNREFILALLERGMRLDPWMRPRRHSLTC